MPRSKFFSNRTPRNRNHIKKSGVNTIQFWLDGIVKPFVCPQRTIFFRVASLLLRYLAVKLNIFFGIQAWVVDQILSVHVSNSFHMTDTVAPWFGSSFCTFSSLRFRIDLRTCFVELNWST